MATYNKFNVFVADLGAAKHDFANDTIRALLTNTAPNAADTVVDTTTTTCTIKSTSNAAEIAAATGYAKKGPQCTVSSWGQSSGTAKLVLADTVITAGADIGPFQYVTIYNDSKGTTSTRPVIAWWNYGTSITLHNGETFTLDFDDTNGVLTIA